MQQKVSSDSTLPFKNQRRKTLTNQESEGFSPTTYHNLMDDDSDFEVDQVTKMAKQVGRLGTLDIKRKQRPIPKSKFSQKTQGLKISNLNSKSPSKSKWSVSNQPDEQKYDQLNYGRPKYKSPIASSNAQKQSKLKSENTLKLHQDKERVSQKTSHNKVQEEIKVQCEGFSFCGGLDIYRNCLIRSLGMKRMLKIQRNLANGGIYSFVTLKVNAQGLISKSDDNFSEEVPQLSQKFKAQSEIPYQMSSNLLQTSKQLNQKIQNHLVSQQNQVINVQNTFIKVVPSSILFSRFQSLLRVQMIPQIFTMYLSPISNKMLQNTISMFTIFPQQKNLLFTVKDGNSSYNILLMHCRTNQIKYIKRGIFNIRNFLIEQHQNDMNVKDNSLFTMKDFSNIFIQNPSSKARISFFSFADQQETETQKRIEQSKKNQSLNIASSNSRSYYNQPMDSMSQSQKLPPTVAFRNKNPPLNQQQFRIKPQFQQESWQSPPMSIDQQTKQSSMLDDNISIGYNISPTISIKPQKTGQRKSIALYQRPEIIDLDNPQYRLANSIVSEQDNQLNSKLRRYQQKIDIKPFQIQKHQTLKRGRPISNSQYIDSSSSDTTFSSEEDEDSVSENENDSDMVTPGNMKPRKKPRLDEIETAKQFILNSAQLCGFTDAKLVRTKSFKTTQERINFWSDDDGEGSAVSREEEDSLKSEIDVKEQVMLDMMKDEEGKVDATLPDDINIQEYSKQLKQKESERGNQFFKRQKMHLQKKKNKDNSKGKGKNKQGTKNLKRKNDLLKRSHTLKIDHLNKVDEDYDENLDIDNQRLRDIYKPKKFIILPDDSFKEKWEITITLLLLLTAIITPYRIAFVDDENLGWTMTDILTDFLFFVDIFLNFFTAIQDENEEVIMDRNIIAKQYLKSWFFIDTISVMPFSYFFDLDDYASLARIARLPKLYRLIKMAKLSRVLKIIKERNTISKYMNEVLKLNVGLERLAFFGFMFFISVHIVSCIWVVIPALEDYAPDTWIVRSGNEDSSEGTLYMAAFYYTVVIVTTIGYGDITVKTPAEQIYCIILLVVGVCGFSFAIGSLSSVLSSLDAKAAKLKEKLQILNDIQNEYKIPYDLYRRLRLALRYDHSKNSAEQINFLSELPQSLRVELSVVMHQELIKSVKFFRKKQPHFIAFVAPLLKPIKVEANQYIYKEGDPIDEIYFLVTGQAGYSLKEYQNAVYVIIDKGYYFGEIDFIYLDKNGLNDGKRKFSAKAIEDCDLLVLAKQDLLLADQEFEDVVSELFKNALHRLKRTLKIKKESKRFYEKKERTHDNEQFQPRISLAMTQNGFIGGLSKVFNINKRGSILTSTMQQIDDGELDGALSSSSEEEKMNSPVLKTGEKVDPKKRLSEILIRKGTIQSAGFLSNQQSMQSQSRDIREDSFQEDESEDLDEEDKLPEEFHNQDDLEQSQESGALQRYKTKGKREFTEQQHHVLNLKKSSKDIFSSNQQIQQSNDKTPASQPSHAQGQKLNFNLFANKLVNRSQDGHSNEQVTLPNKIAAGVIQKHIPQPSVRSNDTHISDEVGSVEGGERWKILKQALNKKVMQIKTNHFILPGHSKSQNLEIHDGKNQTEGNRRNSVKVTPQANVENDNKQLYSQMHDRMNKFESSLEKINHMMQTMMNNQLQVQNSQSNLNSTSTLQNQSFSTANFAPSKNFSSLSFGPSAKPSMGENSQQEGENLKELIKQTLRDAYFNNMLLKNQENNNSTQKNQ